MVLLCGWWWRWTIQGVQCVQSVYTLYSDLTLSRHVPEPETGQGWGYTGHLPPGCWQNENVSCRWGEGVVGGTQGDWTQERRLIEFLMFLLPSYPDGYKYLSGMKLKQFSASYFLSETIQTQSLISHNIILLPTGDWLMLGLWWVNLQFLSKYMEKKCSNVLFVP